jgi:solute carrier family 25 phosphate transporter 23/24/25/41
MKPNDLVTELEHGLEESQNQRDKRVEELWLKLDPQRTGELDLKGLRKGLRKIDHRRLRLVVVVPRQHTDGCPQP